MSLTDFGSFQFFTTSIFFLSSVCRLLKEESLGIELYFDRNNTFSGWYKDRISEAILGRSKWH